MEIERLTLKESVILCLRVEQRCSKVFRALCRSIDPPDESAAALLQSLATQEERQLRMLEVFDEAVAWPRVWQLDEPAIRKLLETHFPTLFGGGERVRMSASAAMSFAERVEHEEERFYDALARAVTEPDARAFFADLAERERSNSRRLDSGAAPNTTSGGGSTERR